MSKITLLLKYITVLSLAILLQACPVSLDFPLEEPGNVPADGALEGIWVNTGHPDSVEVLEARIRLIDRFRLRIEVLKKTANYFTDLTEFDAWVSNLEGEKFLVIQEGDNEKFMHYCYKLKAGELVLYDMSLLDGGTDAVTSTDALREQVRLSLQDPGFFKDTQVFIKK